MAQAKQIPKNARNCESCDSVFYTFPSFKKTKCSKCTRKRQGHGWSRTRLCFTWHNMKRRSRSTTGMYAHVTVCDEWKDFLAFRSWAIKSGYKEGLQIDRKDSTKGYCPENCRWATRGQQSQNRKKLGNAKHSRFKGVGRNNGKWCANARVDGNRVWLGIFPTEIQAAKAYDSFAEIHFGEFAYLNFSEADQ